MEIVEYQERLTKIKEDYNIRVSQLAREYVMSINTVKVGDIIEDHMGHIQVETIQFTKGDGIRLDSLPQCTYSGRTLTKLLKLRRNGEQYRTIYQSNMKKQE